MFNLKAPPKHLFTLDSKIPSCPPVFTKNGPMMIQGCIVPNHTLYLRNLPEKCTIEELEKLFITYGPIMQIYKRRGIKYKQQAFIVYENIHDAEIAIRALQGFPLSNLPMIIQFAVNKSKIVAEKLGVEWKKGKKMDTIKTKIEVDIEEKLPPNKSLFLENLEHTKEQLESLFNSFAGFEQVRYIGVKKVAFIDFDTIPRATIAKTNSHNKEHYGKLLKVNYAKR